MKGDEVFKHQSSSGRFISSTSNIMLARTVCWQKHLWSEGYKNCMLCGLYVCMYFMKDGCFMSPGHKKTGGPYDL